MKSSSATLSLLRAAEMARRAGNLGRKLALGATQGAKGGGGGDVHSEHHGQLALLAVALHERAPHPVGDIPIDVADLIARDVLTQLFEVHAAPFEVAEISPHHGVVDQPIGAHLDAANGFEQLGKGHAR